MSKPTTDEVLVAALEWLAGNRDQTGRPITDSTTWKQLQSDGFDSLDQVELIMCVEDKCDCMIEDVWIEDLEEHPEQTLRQMAEALIAELEEGKP